MEFPELATARAILLSIGDFIANILAYAVEVLAITKLDSAKLVGQIITVARVLHVHVKKAIVSMEFTATDYAQPATMGTIHQHAN